MQAPYVFFTTYKAVFCCLVVNYADRYLSQMRYIIVAMRILKKSIHSFKEHHSINQSINQSIFVYLTSHCGWSKNLEWTSSRSKAPSKRCLFSIPPPSKDCSLPLCLGLERLRVGILKGRYINFD